MGDDGRKIAFAAALSPCLALVAPASMGKEDRKTWLAAAYQALGDLPMDLIQRGARVALRQADHPAKIVMIINNEVRPTFNERRAFDQRAGERDSLIEQQRQARITREDSLETTAEILARNWPTMGDHDRDRRPGGLNLNPERQCSAPSPEDYERLFGVKIGQI